MWLIAGIELVSVLGPLLEFYFCIELSSESVWKNGKTFDL